MFYETRIEYARARPHLHLGFRLPYLKTLWGGQFLKIDRKRLCGFPSTFSDLNSLPRREGQQHIGCYCKFLLSPLWFVQCHHGKTNHPPLLKVGDVIKIGSTDWAFCGYGSKAQGEYSKFKIHQPSALASLAKELGVVK